MTFTDGSDWWKEIPNAIVEQDDRATKAKEWAASQRATLAAQWADQQRAELAQQYPDMAAPAQSPDLVAEASASPSLPAPASSATGTSPSPPAETSSPQPAPSGGSRGLLNDISQFGDNALSQAEAAAACGPAAAVRLASVFGNNIPLKSALEAAKLVGWTSGGGMNGVQNQKKLLDSLGIVSTLDLNPSMDHLIADARSGNPVTISTPNHYWTASDYDPATQKFNVGQSGTVFRGGSTWMTLDQIKRLGGGMNGALFVDSPTSQTPSVAVMSTGQTQAYEPNPTGAPIGAPSASPSAPSSPVATGLDALIAQAQSTVGGAADAVTGAVGGAVNQASQGFQSIVDQARQAVGYTPEPEQPPTPEQPVSPVPTPGFGFDPSSMTAATAPDGLPLKRDVRDEQQTPQPTIFQSVGSALTEEQPWMKNLVQGQTKRMAGEQLTPEQDYAMARGMATGLSQTFGPEELVGRAATTGAGSLAKSGKIAGEIVTSGQPAMADAEFASGGLGKLIPNANRARAAGADAAAAAEGLPTRSARLGANDPRAGAEPPLPGESFTRDPQGNIVGASKAQPSTDTVEGLRAMARQRGLDPDVVASRTPPRPPTAPIKVDTEPGGLLRTLAGLDESSGPAGPQRGQFGMGLDGENVDLPYGGPRPAGHEALGPSGPQRGQFDLSGDSLPQGGPRPIGSEALGPGGPQRGQFDLSGDPLPQGGPRPTGTEALAVGEQVGQVRFPEDTSLYGGTVTQRPDVSLPAPRNLPGGPQVGQARFPEDASLYGETVRRPVGGALDTPGPLPEGVMPGQKPLAGIAAPIGTKTEKAIAIHYNSLLSLWYTHAGNIASNSGQMMARPLKLATAGYPGEAGALVRSYIQGMPEAIAASWDVVKSGASAIHKVEQTNMHPFGTGKVGRVGDAPTTALAAADEFFGTLVYNGTLRSEATRLAKGDQATFKELLLSPTQGMVREAMQQRRLATYTEDPGFLVEKVMKLSEGGKSRDRLAINFVMPFMRTTSNILRRGVGMVAAPVTGPMRIAGALQKGDTRAARLAAADTAIALTFATGFAAKAANGELSGDGPSNKAERDTLISQGWAPHSIKVGDRWIDYSWAGPLGIQMALIANANEAFVYGKGPAPTAEFALDVGNRMKAVLLQASFLGGIGDLFKNTESGAAGAVANFLGSYVPVGGLIKGVAEATDPLAREHDLGFEGVGERLAEKVPVLRQTVRPAQTVLGDPLSNPRYGGGVIRSSQSRPDPILTALGEHGVEVPAPPKTISRTGSSLDIKLTDDEQDRFNTLRGQLVRRYVAEVVARDSFKKLNPQAQADALKSVISTQTESARDWTLKQMGVPEIRRREAGSPALAGPRPSSKP